MARLKSFLLFFALLFLVPSILPAATAQPIVVHTSVQGAITGMTTEQVKEALLSAESAKAEALLVTIDTPGGQLSATFDIVDAIERSRIPVVVYVSPRGARAWSAGTFILLSAHVAAMAPNTIMGSAQPVVLSPFGGSQPVNDTKTINALTAFLVERARIHARNETAARMFITTNLNLNSEQALRSSVIDLVAENQEDLLVRLNGRRIRTINGEVTLQLGGARTVDHSTSPRIFLLTIITDPLITAVAFLVGVYALIFGLTSPGYGAEIVGAFLIVIGLIGSGFSINLGALLLVAIGAAMAIAEAFKHTHGALATSGLVFIIVGSLLLAPFSPTQWNVSADYYFAFLWIIGSAAAVIGGFTVVLVYKIARARMQKPILGKLIGELVETVDDLEPGKVGFVRHEGEYWQAQSRVRIDKGRPAKIVAKEGPILTVEPVEST